MKCHDNKENHNYTEHQGKGHSPMKHMLMMAACCGLPILLLGALPFLGVFGVGTKIAIASIAPFICPLMMLLMIPMMLKSAKNQKSCCNKKDDKPSLVNENE